MKCALNKEKECEILNKKLGDCEIYDDVHCCVRWRCQFYVDEFEKEVDKKVEIDKFFTEVVK